MQGEVTKLEAAIVDGYSDTNRKVVGTNITVSLDVVNAKDTTRQATSVVFAPPNSVLPTIGDEIEISLELIA